MQNPRDMKLTIPIATTPDFRGWNPGLAEVSVEFCSCFWWSGKKYLQICIWIWNSRVLLKYRTIKTEKQHKSVTVECLLTLFLYLFASLLRSLVIVLFLSMLLGAPVPTHQFSPAYPLLMYGSVSKVIPEISSVTEIQGTIASGTYRSPVTVSSVEYFKYFNP